MSAHGIHETDGAGEAGDFRDAFGKFLRTIVEYLNTDTQREQFGKADVYDNAKLNLANNARAIPGSRGKGNDRDENRKGKDEQ